MAKIHPALTEIGSSQRGYDAGKTVKGRKRPIIVDTRGLLLAGAVHWVDIDERRSAGFALARLHKLPVRIYG